MTTLDDIAALAAREQYLAIVSTVRADISVQSSLVNAAFMAHPVTGEQVVAFVTYGAVKLGNLRARPNMAVSFRSGWRYGTVEGSADLIGPADPRDGFDAERIRLLLREIFTIAGGTHDNWTEYDRTMLEQGRTAVFVTPTRVYG